MRFIFELAELLENLRPNSSLISFLAQYKSQNFARNIKDYDFNANIKVYPNYKHDEDTRFLGSNKSLAYQHKNIDKYKLELLSYLRIADIGIKDINNIENSSLTGQESNKERLRMLINSLGSSKIYSKHSIDEGEQDFSSEQESQGTLQFMKILLKVIPALKKGSLLILDELELKLHQNLVAYLIGIFQNPHENPRGAQLIFSFHNSYFMKILKPYQLWFTEKNEQGQTEVFSATDFEDLQNIYERNLEELYRIGRFGATPRGL
jgi:hypothetical protein